MARTGDPIYSGEKGSYQQVGELVIATEDSRQHTLFQKYQQEYPLKLNALSEASLSSQTKGRIRIKI